MEGEEEEGMVLCFALPASCRGWKEEGEGRKERYLRDESLMMVENAEHSFSAYSVADLFSWPPVCPLLPPLLHLPVARPPSDVPRGRTRQVERRVFVDALLVLVVVLLLLLLVVAMSRKGCCCWAGRRQR